MSARVFDFPAELEVRFLPVEVLGQGGMGRVVLATDRHLHRQVAIKIVPAQLASEQCVRRLEREAEVLGRLRHPNVVAVFDAGRTEEGPYLVAEYLRGRALCDPGVPGDPLASMLGVARGLEAVHAAGLLHRDVKPGNVMVTDDERAVLVDFGLALAPDLTRFTREGGVVGTLAYLDPLVMRGAPASEASDWYSWGASLFHLLEGRLPHAQEDIFGWLASGEPAHMALRFEVLPEGDPRRNLLERVMDLDPARRTRCEAERLELLEWLGEDVTPGNTVALAPVHERSGEHCAAGGAPEPPAAGPFRRFAAVRVGTALALIVAGLAGIRWTLATTPTPATPGAGAGSPATPESRAPAPGSPFPAHYAARVQRELTEAVGLALDPEGRLVTDREPGRTYREILDPDPAAWGEVASHLPELALFRDWIRIGGRPEELPVPVRTELEDADARFRAQLLPGPFSVYLAARPVARPEVPSAAYRELRDRARRSGLALPPLVLSGWAGTMVRAYSRTRAHTERIEEDLRHREERGFPGGVHLGLTGKLITLSHLGPLRFLGTTWSNREVRLATREWLREGAVSAHLWLYTLARSLREEPETRPTLALLFAGELRAFRPFLHSHLAFEAPDVLLGGEPEGPWEQLLHAALRRTMAEMRRLAGGDFARLEEEAVYGWQELARRTARSPAEQDRTAWAVVELIRHRCDDRDGAGALELVRAHREQAGTWRSARRHEMVHGLLEQMELEQERFGLTAGELEVLVHEVAGSEANLCQIGRRRLQQLVELPER